MIVLVLMFHFVLLCGSLECGKNKTNKTVDVSDLHSVDVPIVSGREEQLEGASVTGAHHVGGYVVLFHRGSFRHQGLLVDPDGDADLHLTKHLQQAALLQTSL